MMEIPLSKPDITEAERQAVLDVLASGRLSLGPYLERFERAVADYVKARHAVAVSSGTAGLHLSLIASGVEPGDHIITTPFSFVASANVILYVGAKPVFVDVEPDTGNISPEAVEEKIKDEYVRSDGNWVCWKDGRRLRGILPVHVFGHPCRMDEINEIARKYNLIIIEDACEAMGSLYFSKSQNRWLHAGTISRAGVFAFYPNKQITTGEGGVLVSDDEGIARLVRSLSNQGRDDMGTWLVHPRLGYNYRMDEMSAALGFVQMERIEEMRSKRRRVAALYNEILKEIEEIETPPEKPYAEVNPFVYVVKLRIPGRDELMNHLVSNGIGTRPYFTPIHLQPYYSERFGFRKGMFPVAESLGETCFALPFHNMLTEDEITYVAERIKKWLSTRKTTIRGTEDEKTKEAFETKPL
jgi:perosamine synthetase